MEQKSSTLMSSLFQVGISVIMGGLNKGTKAYLVNDEDTQSTSVIIGFSISKIHGVFATLESNTAKSIKYFLSEILSN